MSCVSVRGGGAERRGSACLSVPRVPNRVGRCIASTKARLIKRPRLSPVKTMTAPDRPRDVDDQRCPSCEASLVQQLSVVGGQVWLVCGAAACVGVFGNAESSPASSIAGSSADGYRLYHRLGSIQLTTASRSDKRRLCPPAGQPTFEPPHAACSPMRRRAFAGVSAIHAGTAEDRVKHWDRGGQDLWWNCMGALLRRAAQEWDTGSSSSCRCRSETHTCAPRIAGSRSGPCGRSGGARDNTTGAARRAGRICCASPNTRGACACRSDPVRLEFVVRQRPEAGRGSCSRRPTARRLVPHGPPCVYRET
jgi:hypothetical protein